MRRNDTMSIDTRVRSETSHHHGRIESFDSVRLLATVLVTWQHAASMFGLFETTQWRGISPGQAGVAIFCAISGFLACSDTSPPRAWFARRLWTLFPAYWIVTIAAFAATLFVTLPKAVTPGLFVSQMLGLGYFTHGWELVNVVSWFISLILLCYALLWLARTSGRSTQVLWLITVVAVALAATRIEVGLSRHVAAFSLGALAYHSRDHLPFAVGALVLLLIGVTVDTQMFYAGLGLFCTVAAVHFPSWGNATTRILGRYSYEYFLVHGLALYAAAHLATMTMLSMCLAIVAAMVSAVALNRFVTVARQSLLCWNASVRASG